MHQENTVKSHALENASKIPYFTHRECEEVHFPHNKHKLLASPTHRDSIGNNTNTSNPSQLRVYELVLMQVRLITCTCIETRKKAIYVIKLHSCMMMYMSTNYSHICTLQWYKTTQYFGLSDLIEPILMLSNSPPIWPDWIEDVSTSNSCDPPTTVSES